MVTFYKHTHTFSSVSIAFGHALVFPGTRNKLVLNEYKCNVHQVVATLSTVTLQLCLDVVFIFYTYN